MEFAQIGNLNLQASRIGLGTWAIGGWMWGGTDERPSIDAIRASLDAGVNLIDTAPVYGFGRSEEIVGKALREHGGRDGVIVATKLGMDWSDDGERVWRDASPERIRREIEASLRRLDIEAIDLYQVHWPDALVPVEETAEALYQLHQDGKIRAIGVCNYAPEQMDAFREAAPLASCQPPYNLFEREIDDDVLPYCQNEGIALLTYGALCRGLLTGKMSADSQFTGDDLRQFDPKFQPPRYEQYLAAVERLDRFAQDYAGKRVIHLAARWLLDRGVEIALWGARRPEQVEPIADVMGWSLDDEALAEIDRILDESIDDPVGPEFMAPPTRDQVETA